MYAVKLLEDPDQNNWPSPKEVLDRTNGTWSEDGRFFCTKNFFYSFEFPDIYATRSNNIPSDCSTLSDELYGIDLGFPEREGEVFCSASTDIGYKICQGLVAQGFRLVDER